MPGIFISYRRDDSAGHAGRIFDRLRARFGAGLVFMDVATIDAGVDFVDALQGAVGSCDALVAVIGPQWLAASHDGQRRLDDPHDFVRIELAGALERKVRVLPVLVDGATMPAAADLPPDLRGLARRQAVELRDARWDDDIERLVQSLERIVAAPQASSNAPTSTAAPAVTSPRESRTTLLAAAMVAVVLIAGAAVAWWAGLLGTSVTDTVTTSPASRPSGQTVAPVEPAAPPPAPASTPPPSTAAGTARPTERPTGPMGPAERPARVTPVPTGRPSTPAVPEIVGQPLSVARQRLQAAGIAFTVRLIEDRAAMPGVVRAVTPGAGDTSRVVVTAVAVSTVLVHFPAGDTRAAEALAAHLRRQPSTAGSIVRTVESTPRADLAGRVGYSDAELAGQAEALARDATEFLRRSDARRAPLQAAVRPRVARRAVIVAAYATAP